ncbi:5401_t:CDS:2, partial [Cetraspora pellucida]
ELVDLVKEIQSAKEGVNDIKQSFSWEIQQKWYWALRFTDLFIQSYKFASLEQFIYKIPCRQDDKFLWGLCERLKRLATDSKLDTDICKGGMEFLNNVCQNKDLWRAHPELNEWIFEHIELKTLPKSAQTSASSFPTTLLGDVLLLDKYVRPNQQNDLKKGRGGLVAQLSGLKDQFLSDLDDEFEESLELFESGVNKFLAFKAKKILETTVNRVVASKCRRVLLILSIAGTARPKNGMFNNDEDFIELYLKEKCKLTSDKINVLRERKF